MNNPLSEANIVKALAEQAARGITRKVIQRLQRMDRTLSAEDSGLQNTWDEVCVQVQYEHSFAWDAYDETVRAIIAHLVDELPKHEKEALWLQTEAGFEWDCEESEHRIPYPVIADEIVDYLLSEYVYNEAGRWENRRIRDYIDRSSLRD